MACGAKGKEGEKQIMPISMKAEDGRIEPLNGYVRIQEIQADGDTMSGVVTDQKGGLVKFGDRVYFRKESQVLIRVNGVEVSFVQSTDIIFRTGE